MRARARRTLANAVCELNRQFTPTFAVPVTLDFGDVASEGSSSDFARADHKHGMPREPDDLIDGALEVGFSFTDFCTRSTTTNTLTKAFGAVLYGDAGTPTVGDDPGSQGSFGHFQLDMSGGPAAINGVGYQCGGASAATLDPTDPRHSVGRLEKFSARIRTRDTTAPSDVRTAIGGFVLSSGTDITTITDGVYFYIDRYSNTVNNFIATCTAGSVSTSVDTGVGWAFSTNGDYQAFLIVYDLTTVSFFIDGVLVAEITENIPTSQIAGWMVVAQQRIAGPSLRQVVIDDILVAGRR